MWSPVTQQEIQVDAIRCATRWCQRSSSPLGGHGMGHGIWWELPSAVHASTAHHRSTSALQWLSALLRKGLIIIPKHSMRLYVWHTYMGSMYTIPKIDKNKLTVCDIFPFSGHTRHPHSLVPCIHRWPLHPLLPLWMLSGVDKSQICDLLIWCLGRTGLQTASRDDEQWAVVFQRWLIRYVEHSHVMTGWYSRFFDEAFTKSEPTGKRSEKGAAPCVEVVWAFRLSGTLKSGQLRLARNPVVFIQPLNVM